MSRSYESAKRAHAGTPLTFTLDGVEFACKTDISVLDFSELASYADLDADSPQGIAALQGFFTIMLGDTEFRRFKLHCARHRTDDDTIVTIMGDLADEFLGRPTVAPSTSPSSPSATGSGSPAPGSHTVVNLGRAQVRQVPDLADIGDVEQVS